MVMMTTTTRRPGRAERPRLREPLTTAMTTIRIRGTMIPARLHSTTLPTRSLVPFRTSRSLLVFVAYLHACMGR